MAAQFPTTIPVYTNPTASMTLGSADHVGLHANVNDDVVGIATKLGKGASPPNTAGVMRVTNTATQTTAWGLAQTVDIAANAATQYGIATGTTSSPTTTSTTFVDMPEMAVTLTTVGGDLLAFFHGGFSASAASLNGTIAFKLDAGSDVFPSLINTQVTVYPMVLIGRFTGVAAGSHTVKVRWSISSGTFSLWQTQRTMLVVELKR